MSATGQAAGRAVAVPTAATRRRESRAARIGRLVAHGPLNLFLLFVGVLWLIPTLGLMLTSLLPASEIARIASVRSLRMLDLRATA